MTTVDPAMNGSSAGARTSADPEVRPVRRPRSVLVALSYFWLAVVILSAVLAPVLPLGPFDIAVGPPRQVPGGGSLDLLLGTDQLGRSLLSRVVHGAQVSLVVGTVAGLLGTVIGGTLGMIGGYFGRRVDAVIRLLADAMLAFPPLILLLALSAVLTPSVSTILIGLTLLVIPTFIRLARANTLLWASREFVTAAKNMGAGGIRILFREILPNLLPALAAYLPVVMAALIVAEGSLGFLGMGIPPPTPSWGGMIADGKDAIGDYPHLVFVPATVIFLTVFSLNQAGDHLRRRFDRSLR
ncbi:ABC transporter permease [Amycolatopsis sp. NBRC 101858]|uniref:ABC transporter permease n=1 Tax=Amycolatopsis sp. NBRC 101858 TaxID=3032200 RepID=UPI0024A2DE45|nr:ABC transporter permease [Amycolatopsis sp. NBRC 101858]GLY38951.1 ABC transporter permease [Amycolatopsis sp. NBRC 101858]